MRKRALLLLTSFTLQLRAYAPSNFFRPFDVNFRMEDWKAFSKKQNRYRIGVSVEGGGTAKSRNGNIDRVGLLSIYQSTQSSIAMLAGAQSGSAINDLSLEISPATDDGVRGHIAFKNAKFEEIDYTLYINRYIDIKSLPGEFMIGGYLPIKYMGISGVEVEDQTKDFTAEDQLVKERVSSKIVQVAKDLGGLEVGDWTNNSLGDLAMMFYWGHVFEQDAKRSLEKVKINAKLGLTMPTGKTRDEDIAFSQPFGNDGAWGLPFGGGLDIFFQGGLKFAFDFEVLQLFDETRLRRLKTDVNQTDFLLLEKGRARKNFGFDWKFNIGVQLQKVLGGLSLSGVFNHAKHGVDKLLPRSHRFDRDVVNTAESIKEWAYSDLIFSANYDFFHESFGRMKPQLMLFYKHPVGGKRVFDADTFGGQLAFHF